MAGDIIDTNSVMLANQLLPLGLTIQKKVTIADDLPTITHEISSMSADADILIINGGLGPTIDDLTAQALALCTKVTLKENQQAVEHLKAWCLMRGNTLDNANLKQALLPEQVEIVPNTVGSAVGFRTRFNECDIYCTPGVPSELEIMMNEQVIPSIKTQLTEAPQYQVIRLQLFGIGESRLQQLINDSFNDWPQQIELGFRACSPLLEVKLTIKSEFDQTLLTQWKNRLQQLLGQHILCQITDSVPTMAEHVFHELKKTNKSITFAESCTGGLISSLLTNIAGSSQVFEAGYVTYSNEMKSKMLNVSKKTLDTYGAVSEEVVKQMALGAIANSNADYAIAVSGIAGPDGATTSKPIGSVWIAWGDKSKINTQYFCIKGSRQYFQVVVATRALDLIRRLLISSKEIPFYLS